MRPDHEQLKQIAAYLSAQLNDAERADLEAWMKASSQNKSVFEDAKKIWENSGMRLRLKTDETDEQWLELKSRMEQAEEEKIVSLFGVRSWFLRIAAGLMLLAGVAYFLFSLSDNDITIAADDAVAMVYLPDSSRVWLNVHSALRYPEDFGSETRQVTLTGEGYFEVRPDKVIPFTALTDHTLVEVTGTSFNLREDTTEVVLTVAEGAVKFSGQDAPDEKRVTVKAREKAVWNKKGNVEKSKNADTHFAAWRERNNPLFEKEKQNPRDHLSTAYTWRKNSINQSIIEGTLRNTASLATYKNTVLKVTYTKPDGTATTVRVTVFDSVRPGRIIHYQKRLLDIFTDTRTLEAEIETADIVTSAIY